MLYSRPLVNSVSNLCFLAESQYVVGLVPGENGCPTVLFSGDTGTGSFDYDATIVVKIHFEDGQECSTVIANYSGHTAFQDNVLLLDCSSQSTDCEFNKCSVGSNRTSAEICLDSLTINGEAQNVGICIPISLSDLLDIDNDICPPR